MRKQGWIFLAALLLVFASCKKREGCTDPLSTNYDAEAQVDDGSCTYPTSELSVHFNHTVGGLPFSTSTVFQDSSGRSFQFVTARFYFSNPQLLKNGGAVPLGDYLHVVAGSTTDYNLGEVDPGSYTGFSWDLGIDSVTNHSDPMLFPEGHALSPTSPYNDHWTWNVGFVFLKIEGRADTSAAMTGTLDKDWQMHIATDPLLTPVNLSKAISISQGQSQTLQINIDWLRALSGYDFKRSTHTTDVFSIAQRAMNNFVAGITIE